MFKQLVVKHLAPPKKRRQPQPIDHTAAHEDQEHGPVIESQDHPEHNETQGAEHDSERLVRQKPLNPAVVAHPLQKVAHQFGVKKRHGEFQQLDEEVAHERNVYPHRNVEQQPAAYEIRCRASRHDHQLTQQYEPYKTYVAVTDSRIDNRLSQERHNKLQHAPEQKAEQHLPEMTAIAHDVTHQKPERTAPAFPLVALLLESLPGLEKHRYPFFLAVGHGAYPVAAELLPPERHDPLSRIAYMKPPPIPRNPEKNHEMILIPVQYRRSATLRQLRQRDSGRYRRQAKRLRSLGQTEERHSLGCRRT